MRRLRPTDPTAQAGVLPLPPGAPNPLGLAESLPRCSRGGWKEEGVQAGRAVPRPPEQGAPHGYPPIPSRGLRILVFPLTPLVFGEGEAASPGQPQWRLIVAQRLLVICAVRVREARRGDGDSRVQPRPQGSPKQELGSTELSFSPSLAFPSCEVGRNPPPGWPSREKLYAQRGRSGMWAPHACHGAGPPWRPHCGPQLCPWPRPGD